MLFVRLCSQSYWDISWPEAFVIPLYLWVRCGDEINLETPQLMHVFFQHSNIEQQLSTLLSVHILCRQWLSTYSIPGHQCKPNLSYHHEMWWNNDQWKSNLDHNVFIQQKILKSSSTICTVMFKKKTLSERPFINWWGIPILYIDGILPKSTLPAWKIGPFWQDTLDMTRTQYTVLMICYFQMM